MTTTETTDPGCFCLLCSEAAPDGAGPEGTGPEGTATDGAGRGAFDERDRLVAANVTEFGWHVMGVNGDGEGPEWAYSIGLWHTVRSPEVCVFGLPTDTAMRIVNNLAARVRDGSPLTPDQRRTDVIEGYQVAIRPVHPTWYPSFFGAGIDFQRQPPWPVAQVIWPDKEGRLPFEEGAGDACRAGQPPLWLPKDQVGGAWGAHDPMAGWPFGTTLPYATVVASTAVADGSAPVDRVERDADGTWRFLTAADAAALTAAPTADADADADADGTVQCPLGLVAHLHPDLAAVGALPPGAAVTRTADGGWPASERA